MRFREKAADTVAKVVGSWKFIIIQFGFLLGWMWINSSTDYIWDAPPFILLNLILSFQAAFTAPIIMMSQNRQNHIDRNKLNKDFSTNIKAELQIRQLHEKIDLLKEQEMKGLIEIIKNSQCLHTNQRKKKD